MLYYLEQRNLQKEIYLVYRRDAGNLQKFNFDHKFVIILTL